MKIRRSKASVIFATAVGLSLIAGEGITRAGEPDSRAIVREATLNGIGISEAVDFYVPPRTRSVTVSVIGDTKQLYALASFRTADGQEHVGWDQAKPPAPVLRHYYREEHICHFPGKLKQCPRLGTFTITYPNKRGQSVPPGPTSLKVSSEAANGKVLVRVFLPEEDNARTLHVNLSIVSDQTKRFDSTLFIKKVEKIFEEADIRVVIDNELLLKGTPFSEITELAEPKARLSGAPTDPEETPWNAPARLAQYGHQRLPSSTALNLYVIDSFGRRGIKGVSLGTPGPPMPSSYYFGVLIERSEDYDSMAYLAAHEICHFLGLDHLRRWSVSEKPYSDGLGDTGDTLLNLMGSGLDLTPEQVFVLTRSPLLKTK